MSRFRFRAWDIQEKRMLIWPDILGRNHVGEESYYGLTIKELFRSERFMPMQWIEEKDKIGRNIYEGDIIEPTEGGKFKVFYDFSFARFDTEAEKPRIFNMRPGLNGGTTKYTRIKGNIYETPWKKQDTSYGQEKSTTLHLAFRAWDIEKKKMIPWKEILDSTVYEIFHSEKYAVTQWTGRLDEKQAFIYEGDILKTPRGNPFIVYYAEGIGYWTWPVVPDDEWRRPSIDENQKGLHVVGNVYENPEKAKYNTLENIYRIKEAK